MGNLTNNFNSELIQNIKNKFEDAAGLFWAE